MNPGHAHQNLPPLATSATPDLGADMDTGQLSQKSPCSSSQTFSSPSSDPSAPSKSSPQNMKDEDGTDSAKKATNISTSSTTTTTTTTTATTTTTTTTTVTTREKQKRTRKRGNRRRKVTSSFDTGPNLLKKANVVGHSFSMVASPPPTQISIPSFSPFVSPTTQITATTSTSTRKTIKLSCTRKATAHLVEVYKRCNSEFVYNPRANPRRFLTEPSERVLNEGYDNKHANLIMCVNDVLHSDTGEFRSFRVMDMLGEGTFGQVVKCEDCATKKQVAVKVIKNKPAYYNQALLEIRILQLLNEDFDPNDQYHILRLFDHFVFKGHLCLVFELLSYNLYELIKENGFRGLSCNLIRTFLKQILQGMRVLHSARIIHCDLKPENILLTKNTSAQVKLVDFGSSCLESQTVYSYIQSRFYRSPEVLLGLPYDIAIDMWSLGCIVAELFLGLPIFPGQTQYNQVSRIVKVLGLPPKHMLERGSLVKKFFHCHKHTSESKESSCSSENSTFQLKTPEEFAADSKTKEVPFKKYFNGENLEEIIHLYPYRKSLSKKDKAKERESREALVDLLRGLLQMDPKKRWTPVMALAHPFITREPLGSFNADTIRAQESSENDRIALHQHPFFAGIKPLVQKSAAIPSVPIPATSSLSSTFVISSSAPSSNSGAAFIQAFQAAQQASDGKPQPSPPQQSFSQFQQSSLSTSQVLPQNDHSHIPQASLQQPQQLGLYSQPQLSTQQHPPHQMSTFGSSPTNQPNHNFTQGQQQQQHFQQPPLGKLGNGTYDPQLNTWSGEFPWVAEQTAWPSQHQEQQQPFNIMDEEVESAVPTSNPADPITFSVAHAGGQYDNSFLLPNNGLERDSLSRSVPTETNTALLFSRVQQQQPQQRPPGGSPYQTYGFDTNSLNKPQIQPHPPFQQQPGSSSQDQGLANRDFQNSLAALNPCYFGVPAVSTNSLETHEQVERRSALTAQLQNKNK